jgi:NitT/TauT family transport system permease protein
MTPGADRRRGDRRLTSLVLATGLGAWEAASRAGLLSPLYFPAPSVIALALADLFATGDLAGHLWATVVRLGWGLTLGGVPGLLIGLAMGSSRRLHDALDPIVAAVHPVPKIAIFPLILVLFGIGELSKVIAVAIAAFFPLLISTMTGVRQINPIYFDVARNYGSSRARLVADVVVPGSLPMALAGARLSLNVALLVAIAVELVAPDRGLGAVLWLARETLRVEDLYATLVIVAALGVGMNVLLQRAAVRLIPWQDVPER